MPRRDPGTHYTTHQRYACTSAQTIKSVETLGAIQWQWQRPPIEHDHARVRSGALGPTCLRHHLHGDDRQSAIRLDAVRQSDRSEISLGPRGDPSRLHHFRSHRNLAGALRRLSDRQVRPQADGLRQRRAGRDRLGHQFDGRQPLPSLCRRRDRRHRRRRHLRRLGRQCAEMVPRSARACRRFDGRGLRRRIGADGDPDRQHDPIERLSVRLLLVRPRARHRRGSGCPAAAERRRPAKCRPQRAPPCNRRGATTDRPKPSASRCSG